MYDDLVERILVSEVTVLEELLTVVGDEDHQRRVPELRVGEGAQHASYLYVRVSYLFVVEVTNEVMLRRTKQVPLHPKEPPLVCCLRLGTQPARVAVGEVEVRLVPELHVGIEVVQEEEEGSLCAGTQETQRAVADLRRCGCVGAARYLRLIERGESLVHPDDGAHQITTHDGSGVEPALP